MNVLRRLSVLGAAVTAAGLLAPVGTAAAASASVTMTGVTNGGTVSGALTLTAVGTAGTGDSTDELNFVIDGKSADVEFCLAATCTKTYTWDATGLTGPHTVQAVLTTENGVTVNGTTFTVNVVSPAPTVAVTSPAAGSEVASGSVSVSATGTIDASQRDTGAFGTLLVDGQSADVTSCPTPASQACALTFTWDTSFATGPHTLQVSFETSKGITVSSAPIAVTVHVPTKSLVNRVSPMPYGHTAHLGGTVESTSGTPQAGVAVKVVVKPASGKPVTKTIVTNSDGNWAMSYKAKANASVVATVAESASWGASHASTRLQVFATGHCVTPSLVKAGATTTMKCTKAVPAMSKTKVLVQLLSHHKWHTISSAKVSGTKFSVKFRLATKGSAQVRLVLPATKALVVSETSTFYIAVD